MRESVCVGRRGMRDVHTGKNGHDNNGHYLAWISIRSRRVANLATERRKGKIKTPQSVRIFHNQGFGKIQNSNLIRADSVKVVDHLSDGTPL
jgi:hypothetical protein